MKDGPRTLSELPIGSRLLYRAKDDWRTAVVSKMDQERVIVIVCSPTGRTYRISRDPNARIIFDGSIPVLRSDALGNWRLNFAIYDFRW